MNSKITLGKIAKELSARSGKPQADCESLLKAFFSRIGSALEHGETVKVRNFGSFKISRVESRKSVDVTSGNDNEIPEHNKVVFLPAKELAAAVNAPFEMFETIELEDNVLEDELLSAEAEGDSITAGAIEQQIIINEEKHDDLINELSDSPAGDTTKASDSPLIHDTDPEDKTGDTDYSDRIENTVTAPADFNQDSKSSDNAAPEHNHITATSENTEINSPVPADINDDSENNEETISPRTDIADAESPDKPDDNHEVLTKHTQRGFGHGFFWGIAATVALLAIVTGTLWLANDNFAEIGRSILGSTTSSKSELQADAADPGSEPDDNVNKIEEPDTEAAEKDISAQDNPDAFPETETGKDVADNPDNVVPTKPSDPIVYDTITKTHYLTTMAKKHYGNYHLWPYIYKENERILGHPDRIRPGTRVVIPKLSKYGVNPDSPSDIAKAKKLGIEIYARYQ